MVNSAPLLRMLGFEVRGGRLDIGCCSVDFHIAFVNRMPIDGGITERDAPNQKSCMQTVCHDVQRVSILHKSRL